LGNARPRWDKNTVKATAIADLKLFGDAMHAQLGDEYFLYARSSATVKIAAETLPKTTEWKEVARTLIAKRHEFNVPAEESVDDREE
jgi:hypothetical protein